MARTQINASLIPTAQYLSKYRRPNLLYVSGTQVQTEAGLIDGNSSNTHVLFPDGELRVDNTFSHVVFDITRNAIFNGSNQSGLRSGLSEANDTWYAIYAVKEQNSTGFVLVGDTVLPIKTNYATLNSNFGTNGWIYLGAIRNGDGASNPSTILGFVQIGNETVFVNNQAISNPAIQSSGILLATTASASSLTYTYSAGTSGTSIPNNFGAHLFVYTGSSDTQLVTGANNTSNNVLFRDNDATIQTWLIRIWINATFLEGNGTTIGNQTARPWTILITGWKDLALGIASNPLF